MQRPLILVTNDDGIESAGLWAVVEALLPLGEILVVAPDRQWSGAGRSMPPYVTGCITPAPREIRGEQVAAYAVDATPALAVIHAVTELAARPLSLVVSGINFGTNLGIEITISGTVGAALEGGAFGIPALAISLEMDPAYHLTGDDSVDYCASMAFTRRFAWQLLSGALPRDVDALNVNIPSGATPNSPWRLTRLSRGRYYVPLAPDRADGKGRPGFKLMEDFEQAEPDSDIRAVKVDGVVSVTPLSLDMTSRSDFDAIQAGLGAPPIYVDVPELLTPAGQQTACLLDLAPNINHVLKQG